MKPSKLLRPLLAAALSLLTMQATWATATVTPTRGEFSDYYKVVITGTMNGTTAVDNTFTLPLASDAGSCTLLITADTGTGTPTISMAPTVLGCLISEAGCLWITEAQTAVSSTRSANKGVNIFENLVNPTAHHTYPAGQSTMRIVSGAASDGTFTITCYFHAAR